MKNPKKMTAERLIHWMDKTINSANKAVDRGRIAMSCLPIIARHTELKDTLVEYGVWNKFCAERGLSIEHNGYDLFA